MKDSQLAYEVVDSHFKYIKANNERFSTVDTHVDAFV